MVFLRHASLPLLTAATTAIVLTSCSPGDDDSNPTCVDGVIDVGTERDIALDDDCPLLRINGTDTTVELSGVQVDEVEIRGDRNQVEGDEIEAVRISGQENGVEAVRLGAVEIHGDRNTASAQGEVGSIAVHGNENESSAD